MSKVGSSFWSGLWRLADPKISITSIAAMLVGASVAWREDSLSWYWLLLTGLAFFAMEVAKNAWGDIYDFDSGTDLAVKPEDRTDFSGGKRVLVDELLTRQQTWGIAFAFGLLGVLLGVLIVVFKAPAAIWIGLVGLVLGWSYHGPPLQMAYRGLGELDVVLCYGPLLCLATYVIQTNSYSMEVLLMSLPLGVLIAAFLWVNEFPDFHADAAHGKHNLVVRLGKTQASRLLPLFYLAAAILCLVMPWLTAVGFETYLSLVFVIPGLLASYWVWQQPLDFYRHKPAQPMALLSFVLYALGIAVAALFHGPVV